MNHELGAVDLFEQGFNCAQSVFAAYSESFGMDRETALKLASSFGGGLGRLGMTCGAVSGAALLISLKYSMTSLEDKTFREKNYAMVQDFCQRFAERNQSLLCSDLMGVDLISDDKALIEQRVKTVCVKAVRDAAEIVEDLLEIESLVID